LRPEEVDVDTKTKTGVKTNVATLTRADVRSAIRMGGLSDEEERYVRMRFGISEGPESKLSRRGAEFPETRAQIALMEANMLARQGTPATSNPVKERIIERLKKI
jgi:hypothetical protein